MKCPSCSSEILPVRETSSMVGSHVSHPRNCRHCGAELTEKCPVCTLHHIKDAKYCESNGVEIAAFVAEDDAWKRLLQSLGATLSVRPAVEWIAYCALAVPFTLVWGWFVLISMDPHGINAPGPQGPFGWVAFSIFAVTVWGVGLWFIAGGVDFATRLVGYHRRALLFNKQGYRLIKGDDSRLLPP